MGDIKNLASAIIFLYDFPQQLIEIVNEKVNLAQDIIAPLIYALLGIEIVSIGMGMMMGNMANGNVVFLRIIKIVFLFFIITNIHKLGYVLLDGFRHISFKILEINTNDSTNIFDNPSDMLDTLKHMFVDPLKLELQKAQELTQNVQGGLGDKIVAPLILKIKSIVITIVYYVVFILFSILFLQLLLAKLEFAIVIFFAVILVPFMLNDKLKFLSDNVFTSIFGSAIKIGMTYFMMGIVFNLLTSSGEKMLSENATTAMGIETIISFLIYIALALYLSFFGPKIAMTLICGVPQLGLAQMLHTAIYSRGPMAMAMKSTGRKFSSGAREVGSAVKSGVDAVNNLKQGGGSAFGEKSARMQKDTASMNKNFSEMYTSKNTNSNTAQNYGKENKVVT